MIDTKHIALMNAELDGETTPEESASLKAILAADEESRNYFEELTRLAGMLAEVPLVEPPPELRAGILRDVRHPRVARRPVSAPAPAPRIRWWDAVARGFQGYGRLTWAYGFAAGLVIGLLGLALVRGGPTDPDRSQFVGSMKPLNDFALLESRQIDQNGVRGTLETRAGDGEVLLKVRLDSSPADVEVVVSYDPDSFRPTGFRQDGAVVSHINLNDNELRFHPHGRQTTLLALSRLEGGGATQVHLQFRSGEQAFECSLAAEGSGS